MPALQPQVQLITLEQYEAFSEDKRVEVFDGVVYDMASPSQIHQTISMELSNIIYNYIKSKKGSCQLFSALPAIRQTIMSTSSTTTKMQEFANTGL